MSDEIFSELPLRVPCASHTASLVATADLKKIFAKFPDLEEVHVLVMKKCDQIWSKIGKPHGRDIVKEITGRTFKRPVITRWNSLFDSLTDLLEYVDQLNRILRKLNQDEEEGDSGKKKKSGSKYEKFTKEDMNYMKFLVHILSPLATALDILQGDAMYGILAPTIHSLYSRYLGLSEQYLHDEDVEFQFLPLNEFILSMKDAIYNRYSSILDLDESKESARAALLAAVCHPYFKFRWIRGDLTLKGVKEERLKTVLIAEMKKMVCIDSEETSGSDASTSATKYSSFFVFENQQHLQEDGQVHTQLIHYLADLDDNVSALEKYPLIKRIFLKYNCVTPSSAPIERFFYFASLLHSTKRPVTDENFENILLLRANNNKMSK
jgi:hypothetical protein